MKDLAASLSLGLNIIYFFTLGPRECGGRNTRLFAPFQHPQTFFYSFFLFFVFCFFTLSSLLFRPFGDLEEQHEKILMLRVETLLDTIGLLFAHDLVTPERLGRSPDGRKMQ